MYKKKKKIILYATTLVDRVFSHSDIHSDTCVTSSVCLLATLYSRQEVRGWRFCRWTARDVIINDLLNS